MPEFIKLLSELREQMSAELTRSDVLRALIWPNAGLLLAFTAAISAHAPNWCLVVVAGMLGVFMLLYAVAYVFFALTDPDALRSEKYKLQKIAIEKGLFGDSLTGLKQIDESPTVTKTVTVAPILGHSND